MLGKVSEVAFSKRMEVIRGKLESDKNIAPLTWLKVGGMAELFFRPQDESDLSEFLKRMPQKVAHKVLGNASNLLIRDGGIPGVVIRLGPNFSKIEIIGNRIMATAFSKNTMVIAIKSS